MIDINLSPPNLRKKHKKKMLPGGINIPLEIVIGIGGGLFMLLVLVHIGLLMTNIYKLSKKNELDKEWQKILPQKENVDEILKGVRLHQKKIKEMESVFEKTNIPWAQQLNILSDSLPRGVWLTKVALIEDTFFIKGRAISWQKEDKINVLSLISNLKKEEKFTEYLSDLELDSIQSKQIGKTKVNDFLIQVKLK